MTCVVPQCTTKLDSSDALTSYGHQIPWDDSIQAMRWVNHLVSRGTPLDLIDKNTYVCEKHLPERPTVTPTNQTDADISMLMSLNSHSSVENICSADKYPVLVDYLEQENRMNVNSSTFPTIRGQLESNVMLDTNFISTEESLGESVHHPEQVESLQDDELQLGLNEASVAPREPLLKYEVYFADDQNSNDVQQKLNEMTGLSKNVPESDGEYLAPDVISVKNVSRETIVIEDKPHLVYTLPGLPHTQTADREEQVDTEEPIAAHCEAPAQQYTVANVNQNSLKVKIKKICSSRSEKQISPYKSETSFGKTKTDKRKTSKVIDKSEHISALSGHGQEKEELCISAHTSNVCKKPQRKLSKIQQKHPTICAMLAAQGKVMPFPHSPILPVIKQRHEDIRVKGQVTSTMHAKPLDCVEKSVVSDNGQNLTFKMPSVSLKADQTEPSCDDEDCVVIEDDDCYMVSDDSTINSNQNISPANSSQTCSPPKRAKSSASTESHSSAPDRSVVKGLLSVPPSKNNVMPNTSGPFETLADKYMKDWQPTGQFSCKYCSYSSVTCSFLFRHWLFKHSNKFVFQCMYCPAYHEKREPLLMHNRWSHHGKRHMVKVVPKPELAKDVEQEFQSLFSISIINPKADSQRENQDSAISKGHVESSMKHEAWFGACECLPLEEKLQFKLDEEGLVMKERLKHQSNSQSPTEGKEATEETSKKNLLDDIYEGAPEMECKQCNITFTHIMIYFRHWLHEHWKNYLYKCVFCGGKYGNKKRVMAHLNKHRCDGRNIVLQFDIEAQLAFEKEKQLQSNVDFGNDCALEENGIVTNFLRTTANLTGNQQDIVDEDSNVSRTVAAVEVHQETTPQLNLRIENVTSLKDFMV